MYNKCTNITWSRKFMTRHHDTKINSMPGTSLLPSTLTQNLRPCIMGKATDNASRCILSNVWKHRCNLVSKTGDMTHEGHVVYSCGIQSEKLSPYSTKSEILFPVGQNEYWNLAHLVGSSNGMRREQVEKSKRKHWAVYHTQENTTK